MRAALATAGPGATSAGASTHVANAFPSRPTDDPRQYAVIERALACGTLSCVTPRTVIWPPARYTFKYQPRRVRCAPRSTLRNSLLASARC
jgi:hypothetical protein